MRKNVFFIFLLSISILFFSCEKTDVPIDTSGTEVPEEPVEPEVPDSVPEQDDPANGIILDLPGITLKGWVHCNQEGLPGVVVTDGTNVTEYSPRSLLRHTTRAFSGTIPTSVFFLLSL